MGLFTSLGFGCFFLVSLAVGLRLVLQWRRTRQLPELLIGIGVLGIGPVGFALTVVAQLLVGAVPLAAACFYGFAQLAVNLGAFAKLLFNGRVYHPGSVAARVAVWLGGAALVAAWVDVALGGFVVEAPGPRHAPLVAALLWGSVEALRYHGRMRRRARIGLGDPVVENRFLLWGVGAGAAGVGSLVGVVAGVGGGAQLLVDPVLLGVLSLHGSIAAVCMWLAFLPPRAYTRFLSERAPAAA